MIKLLRNIGLLLGLLWFAVLVNAQVNDAGLWTEIDFTKKLNQSFSVRLSNELRLNENLSEPGTINNELGFIYRFNKKYRISATYRFANKRLIDNSYSQRHRFYVDITASETVKPLQLVFRARFQQQFKDICCSEYGLIPDYYARAKFSLKWRVSHHIEPFVSSELFFPLNKLQNRNIDEYRITGGIEYTFNLRHSVEVFYMYNREFGRRRIYDSYIAGIAYHYNF